ncbi:MAG: SAM-dependent methyltransferase [Pseudomonadota bacterium]
MHPRLDEVLFRHLHSTWQQPIHEHSRQAFESIRSRAESAEALVLDSGCGVGQSTAQLADRHPNALVLGIDKSSHRLARSSRVPDNALLLRADLTDFWRLASAAGWSLEAHYLLYPNPWPKAVHLQRRWHAHPVFPVLLALGGRLELRTNFRIYADEFRRALRLAGVCADEVVSFRPDFPISPFEAKYDDSGHDLYRLTVQLETQK